MATDPKTATRTTLGRDWQERQKLIDWMHAPGMPDYVNRLVSGRSLADGGHWALYARDRHLAPMRERRGRGLSVLSLACGSGHVEAFLIDQLEWPVGRLVGLEYDAALRGAAVDHFAPLDCESEVAFFDFNDLGTLDVGTFDVIFTCHSIHHCTDLEGMLAFINRSLEPDGIFMGIDYFGPSRFQIEPEAVEVLHRLFAMLPPHLRRNLQTGDIEEVFARPTIQQVREADPSESPRSSDLRSLLFSNFPTIEVQAMGGTLLRWLLQYRAGNFDPENPSDLAIVQMLQFIEQTLIEDRTIRSDDLFFVLGRSDRV
ncbi:MAG: class I SAM-dependent methyltransferase [Acidobacteriota bacterium]